MRDRGVIYRGIIKRIGDTKRRATIRVLIERRDIKERVNREKNNT
jgi:hypothetical protein